MIYLSSDLSLLFFLLNWPEPTEEAIHLSTQNYSYLLYCSMTGKASSPTALLSKSTIFYVIPGNVLVNYFSTVCHARFPLLSTRGIFTAFSLKSGQMTSSNFPISLRVCNLQFHSLLSKYVSINMLDFK